MAIYTIALHTVLWGIAPLAASHFDPYSVICQGAAEIAAPAEQSPASPAPSHACDHCNLCSASAAPLLVSVIAGQLAPARLLQVLQPASAAASDHLATTPHLARGPPPFA